MFISEFIAYQNRTALFIYKTHSNAPLCLPTFSFLGVTSRPCIPDIQTLLSIIQALNRCGVELFRCVFLKAQEMLVHFIKTLQFWARMFAIGQFDCRVGNKSITQLLGYMRFSQLNRYQNQVFFLFRCLFSRWHMLAFITFSVKFVLVYSYSACFLC